MKDSFKQFLKGMGSVLDLFGTSCKKPHIMTPEEAWVADGKAIQSDWDQVAKDFGFNNWEEINQILTKEKQ